MQEVEPEEAHGPRTETQGALTSPPPPEKPPAKVPELALAPLAKHSGRRKLWRTLGFAGIVVLGALGGGLYWWTHRAPALPAGIAWGNGRVEADDIDITPKYPGRVAALLVDEGDLVKQGQVVARMDTRDVEANLRKARAEVQVAIQTIQAASADVTQQKTQLRLAQLQLERTRTLNRQGYATRELLDQRQQSVDAAVAALQSVTAKVSENEHSLAAAAQDVAYYQIMLDEGNLVAPRTARVQYRLVNTGEVIAAGAKIFTLLDLSNVYMTVFLPTEDAGKVALGAEGRMVLDALPGLVVPGKVSFIAPTAQFTPKAVETQSERDKLMFRIKVRIDPTLLANHVADIRTGLPGVAYIGLDPGVVWPERLRVTPLPQGNAPAAAAPR